MKLYQFLTVAVLAATVLCGSVAAKCQDDKLIGNGRLLRRLRNEAIQKFQPNPKDSKQSSKTKKDNSRDKVPTLVGPRPTGKVPTPALKSNYASKSASKPSPVASPTMASRADASSIRPPVTKNATESSTNPSPGSLLLSKPNRTASKPKTGFGMKLELIADKFTVTKVDTRGNAHEAGLQKGDLILQVGGITLGSLEEFEEITKILDQGDQVEFSFERRGEKSDVTIQFGVTPVENDLANSSQLKAENDYSFVPEGDDNSQTGLHSVLSQPQPSANRSGFDLDNPDKQQTIEKQPRQIEQMRQGINRLNRK